MFVSSGQKKLIAGAAVLVILIVIGLSYIYVFSQARSASGATTSASTGVTTTPQNPQQTYKATCQFRFGYTCKNLTVTGGKVSFTFSQQALGNAYNLEFACSETINQYGGPYALGVNPFAIYGKSPLPPNTQLDVTNLQCYGGNGQPLTDIGNNILSNASIFINVTSGPGSPGGKNPWITHILGQFNKIV